MADPRPHQHDRDVALALGATPVQADAAVAALENAGLLDHGLLVAAGVAAARWGIEITDAVLRLADGAAPPRDPSDYELRTAVEESQADLEDRWRQAVVTGRDQEGHWIRLGRSRPDAQ